MLEMQKNVCIICYHKMDNNHENSITIPCGCNFCDIRHFEFFFNDKKRIEIGKEFVCYCSYKYTIKDIYNLGLICSEKSRKLLRRPIIDYLNYILNEECCNCGCKEPNLNRIRYKDKNEENIQLLAKYKELKHYFCKACVEKIKEKEPFLCNICDKEHIFRSKK